MQFAFAQPYTTDAMIRKRAVRGRATLALVATLDAQLLLVTLALLLTAIDLGNSIDTFLLAVHVLHIVSALLAYVVVRHSMTVVDSLRILMLVYSLLTVVDASVVIARVIMLAHDHDALRHMHLTLLTRLALALGLTATDAVGVFFANLAQSSVFSIEYSNEQLLSLASRATQPAVNGPGLC